MQSLPQAKFRVFAHLHDKRYRRKHGLFVAEGFKLLHEALRQAWVPKAVVVPREAAEGERSLPPLPPETDLWAATPQEWWQLCRHVQPEGVLSIFALPTPPPPGPLQLPALALWDVQDPGNLGTLLRTAHWFGFAAAYLSPGCADAWNPKAVRAGMGAQFALNVLECPNLADLLRENAQHCVAASLRGQALEAWPAGRQLLLLGSESHGLPPHLEALPGLHRVRIAGRPPARAQPAESLNVAAAAAILAHAMTFSARDGAKKSR